MWWMAIAAAGQALIGGQQSGKEASKQETRQWQAESDALTQNVAENQAIAEANFTNMVRTGYRQGLLNVQRAQAKRQARAQGIDLNRSVQRVLSASTANAAAAGSVGPSTEAVAQDIAVKEDQAAAQQSENLRVTEENFDNQMSALIMAGQDSIQSSRKVRVRQASVVYGPSTAEIALGAAFAAFSTYNQFSKGPT